MKDFLIAEDENGNKTLFADGDLMAGECADQNKLLLLLSEPGEWKEFPSTGVGIHSYMLSEDLAGLRREVRVQFEGDGMKVNEVNVEGKFWVDASY